MKRLSLCAAVLAVFAVAEMPAQNLANSALASPAKPQSKPAEKEKGKEKDKDPIKAALSGGAPGLPKEAITTEVYADEAFFDSPKSIGIFTGHVIVKDPRFNVQSDKMTIYMTKTPKPDASEKAEGSPTPSPSPSAAAAQQGLEKAVAEGNVGVVRETPGENGAPPVRSIGRADIAIYTTSDGNVELRGSPRVTNGLNTHVATSPDTVMFITQDGKLTTRGPSRTEIRQDPKPGETPKP